MLIIVVYYISRFAGQLHICYIAGADLICKGLVCLQAFIPTQQEPHLILLV